MLHLTQDQLLSLLIFTSEISVMDEFTSSLTELEDPMNMDFCVMVFTSTEERGLSRPMRISSNECSQILMVNSL